MKPLDGAKSAADERHAEAGDGVVQPAIQPAAGVGQSAWRRRCTPTMRSRLASRHVSRRSGAGRPVSSARYSTRFCADGEQRLEQQMQQQVVAPDVDDEGDRRPDLRDVGEVLIRADADIRAAGDARRLQRRDHVEVRALVRDQVVGVEIAALFREPLDPRRRTTARSVARCRAAPTRRSPARGGSAGRWREFRLSWAHRL